MVSNGSLSRVITADVSRAIGLDELPDDQREEFVAAVDAEFHRRFADTIRKNADPAAVAELDALSEADVETLLRWVERHRPGYRDDPLYDSMVRKAPAGEDPQSVAFDYAVTVWLRVNRQDYLAALMINARTMRQELLDRFA